MDGDLAILEKGCAGLPDTEGGVLAALSYLLQPEDGGKPFAYQYDPPPGVPQRSGRYVERIMPVADGRILTGSLSLDRQGFLLRRHRTAVADLYDNDEVRARYYPEAERLVAEATGASRVLAFDHNQRNADMAAGVKGVKQPVPRVHNDYTEKSGPQRLRDLLGDEDARRLEGRRFAIVNVWRPIAGPVEDWPLAVCDAQSIAREDLVATDLIYPGRVGETYAVAYNPRHSWFYFPKMRSDEALLLKCYDSDPARARFTAHTAFHDPSAPAGAAPRQSIEVRTLAIF
jgi:hypothetical protein